MNRDQINFMDVGMRIRELRLNHYMSQKAFAEALHITQGHLSKAERGSVISDALIDLIIEKFGVKRNWLLYGTSEPKNSENPVYVMNPSHMPPLKIPEGMTETPGKTDEWVYSADDMNYKNLKRPGKIPEISKRTGIPIRLLRFLTESAEKGIRLIEEHDGKYAFLVPEIRDTDSILHEDRGMYPAEAYVFSVSLNMFPMCYQWTAKEEEHVVIPKEMLPTRAGLTEKQVLELVQKISEKGSIPRRKWENNNCIREPYAIEMNSAFDNLSGEDGEPSLQEICDYREAKSIALYYGLEGPENENDPKVHELLSLDARITGKNRSCPFSTYGTHFDENGYTDWKLEFDRFRMKIRETVVGKSLEAREIDRCFLVANSLCYNGQEFSLHQHGKAFITAREHEYGPSNLEFIVDDKRISGEQFLDLLSVFEGWTMEFSFRDKS